VVIPGSITIFPVEGELLAHRRRKVLRMVTILGFLTLKDLYRQSTFLKKFKNENIIKMKNKPDPAILQTSFPSNEIKKWHQKSHETVPLRVADTVWLQSGFGSSVLAQSGTWSKRKNLFVTICLNFLKIEIKKGKQCVLWNRSWAKNGFPFTKIKIKFEKVKFILNFLLFLFLGCIHKQNL
jgi:hypothetical protein